MVYEPTGGYAAPLAQALRTAGLPARRAHPNRVRAYAQASEPLAKTDRLDAPALARYGAAFDGPEHPQPEDEPEAAAVRAELPDLLRRREQPVPQRVPGRNRLDQGRLFQGRLSPKAAASLQRHVAWLDDEIAQLEAE